MEALAAYSSNAALAQESGTPVLATVFFWLDQSSKGAQERPQGFFAFAMSPMFYTCATAPGWTQRRGRRRASGPLQAAADPGTREMENARGAAVRNHQPGDARGGGRARRGRGQPLARDARAGGRVGRRRSRRPVLVQPADTGKPPKAVSLSAASHPKPPFMLLGPPGLRRGRGRGAPRRGWGRGGSGGRSIVAPRRRPWAARRGHGGVRDARGDATVSEADVRAQAIVEG
ncbi:hypothetical protein U9M48_017692 [Paspalum notatum var. saurae]|uniref:Uncharacterized protein n=1 Tax=Paspalum notatum var. saurae TaxID=547442 RepID=A0AAQ3WPJ5_PASNO